MNAVPYFELWRSRQNLQGYFPLTAPNHEVIFASKGYTTRADVGIARAMAHAAVSLIRPR